MIAIQGAADSSGRTVTLLIEGESIRACGPADQLELPLQVQRIDASGLLITPGFIDLQFNGGFGLDFTAAPASIWEVAAQLPRYGVTAFLPTIITSPLETFSHAQAVLEAGPPAGFRGAQPLGLHIEGPYLNPAKKGAHNPAYLRAPKLEEIAAWSPDQQVLLVTLAPELPGAEALIRALSERGVVVSAGHSMATYDEMCAAIDAGVRAGTHLFNAMPPLLHRDPGLIAALLEREEVIVGLIPDGLHVHPALVRLLWRAAGDRIAAVTDAMAAMGSTPGTYHLGDYTVTVDSVSARLADGTLAGSIITMDEALRSLARILGPSVSRADLLAAFTSQPARLLGLTTRGRLDAGCRADIVLLSSDLQVEQTWVAGEQLYRRHH